MISARETIESLYGAFRLALFDAQGKNFLGATEGAFWRSFTAAGFVAPLFLLLLFTRMWADPEQTPLFRFFLIEFIGYVIAWVLFPVVMAALVEFFDRREKFIAYIVAYNWAAVWQNALFLPIAILGLTEVIPTTAASMLGFVTLFYILAYSWFVARTVLDLPGPVATGIVVLDLVLSMILNSLIDSLH